MLSIIRNPMCGVLCYWEKLGLLSGAENGEKAGRSFLGLRIRLLRAEAKEETAASADRVGDSAAQVNRLCGICFPASLYCAEIFK